MASRQALLLIEAVSICMTIFPSFSLTVISNLELSDYLMTLLTPLDASSFMSTSMENPRGDKATLSILSLQLPSK